MRLSDKRVPFWGGSSPLKKIYQKAITSELRKLVRKLLLFNNINNGNSSFDKSKNARARKQLLCPLCGKPVMSLYHVRAHIGGHPLSIGECSECRLAFHTCQPSKQESIDYINWRWSSTDSQDRYVTDIESKIMTCRDRLRWLDSFSLPNKRLLDIGAGNGVFCYTAKEFGYEVTGTETSSQAVKRAKELFGVVLIYGDIDSITPNPQFGIFTMWDVIEHLRDPLKMLKEARARTMEGGVIVIETGNYESFTRLEMKERWPLYLFDHMFYFSPSSLEKIVYSAGFSDFQLLSREIPRCAGERAIYALQNPKAVLKFLLTNILHQPEVITRALGRKRWPKHWNLPLLIATAKKLSQREPA